ARDMNRLADTLAQNQIARQQWIADISHELRTPIAVIRAELEGMIDGIIASDPEQLMSLNEEIQRLTRLVDDLHQLSLSDRGALTYNMDKENLYDL
ncbi:two-component sensor histidine kinase, partial [Pseudoalteromonas sp. S3178]